MVAGAGPSHRTALLGTVAPRIWGLPNFGPPKNDRFERLRIEYRPAQEGLSLDPAKDRLILGFGARHAALLRTSFIDLMLGRNDFGIASSDDRYAGYWMFW